MKPSKLLLSLAVLAVAFLTGCTRIGPGHAGIKINQAGSDKGVSEQTASTGWFFYNPFTETVIEYQTAQRMEKWTKNPSVCETHSKLSPVQIGEIARTR